MSVSPRSRSRCGKHLRRPKGNTLTFALGSIVVVAALSMAGWWMFGSGSGEEYQDFLTTLATQGPYDFVVIEQGAVESASNTEIRCQVRSRGGGGGGGGERGGSSLGGSSTTILDVIPEGTMVKKGDWLLDLDSASLKLEE